MKYQCKICKEVFVEFSHALWHGVKAHNIQWAEELENNVAKHKEEKAFNPSRR